MMTQDAAVEAQRELQEQAAREETRAARECSRLRADVAGLGRRLHHCCQSGHRGEIDEALGLATARWERLFGMEAQVQRETQDLALRPRKRPGQFGDDMLSGDVLLRLRKAYEQETKGLQDELADLRKLAAAERKELEGLPRK